MAQAKRDDNYIPTLLAVSNADGTTPVVLWADPTTHRLLVSASSGSLNDLSDVVITSAAQGQLLYNDGTNWVNLAVGTSGKYLKTQGAGANPMWDTPTVTITGTDTHVMFFDGANTPSGEAGFTYNKTTDVATLVGGLVIGNGGALKTTTTLGNTLLIQAYDNDTGPGYITFGTLTAGNSPSFELDNTTLDTSIAKGTWTASGTWTIPAVTLGGTVTGSYLTASEILITDGSKNIVSAPVATYPSLTELSYVKGVTSVIQTQIGTKAAHATTITIAGTANQITSSAGAQDLSANRTWTLSLPADVLIPTILTVPNTGLHILDSNTSHDLIIKPGSDLTADKTLTITTGDADMILNLTAVTDEYVLAYDTSTNTWRGVAGGGVGDMVLASVQSVTGLKTFDTTKLAIKGSSTGTTAIASANAGASDYTQTLQAKTGTVANSDDVTYIGTTSVALNRASAALTLAGITLTTPDIGTPSAGVATNITGLVPGNLIAGTLAAKINLGEGADTATIGLEMDAAMSADEKYSGITVPGTAGATISFGDLCYLDVTATEWLLADASAASTAGDVVLGICVDASTDGNATSMLLIGTVRSAAFPASIALGAPVYVSETAGDVTATAPTTTDSVMRRVGWAITAEPNTIYFNPSNDYITHT